MSSTVTIFEHEPKRAADHGLTERHLRLVDRVNRAVGTEVLRASYRSGGTLTACQHVGVIRLGNRTIQILPKIDYPAHGQTPEQTATRNLLYMVAYAGQIAVREHDVASLLSRDTDWFEILTRLFASHLMDEWQRGVVRGYVVVEDDLPVLRGKWRIGDQLRRPECRHLFAVAYDEFTADNPLNRVFRFVVERLWHLTRDAPNRQTLGELQQWMEEVHCGVIQSEAMGRSRQ